MLLKTLLQVIEEPILVELWRDLYFPEHIVHVSSQLLGLYLGLVLPFEDPLAVLDVLYPLMEGLSRFGLLGKPLLWVLEALHLFYFLFNKALGVLLYFENGLDQQCCTGFHFLNFEGIAAVTWLKPFLLRRLGLYNVLL